MTEYGLGAKPSPPDPRDFPISKLYALRGITPVAVPDNYTVPALLPPILNQGNTPQCVAYSSASLKGYEDRIDQGQFFDWDEAKFFLRIGGGIDGAYVRDAFKQMLANGYPVRSIDTSTDHKIAAYYAVPVTILDMQNALMAFGPLVLGMTWYNSMFNPSPSGIITVDTSSGVAGGHAIFLEGWALINGGRYWILRNSWGSGWGLNGVAYMPFSATHIIGEVWKAVDAIEVPFSITITPYIAPKLVTVHKGFLTGYNAAGQTKTHFWWHDSRCHADAHVSITGPYGIKPPRGEFERIKDGFYAGYWILTSKVTVS